MITIRLMKQDTIVETWWTRRADHVQLILDDLAARFTSDDYHYVVIHP